jgi:hypothetical protein
MWYVLGLKTSVVMELEYLLDQLLVIPAEHIALKSLP